MNNILLFEPDSRKVPHLVFVLKLARINCTVAKTVNEVINWLSAAHMMVTHFDLLLLNNFDMSYQESLNLSQSVKLSQIPVIAVKRTKNEFAEALESGVTTCSPDNLLICLQQQLVSNSHHTTRENGS